jgi:hypothetical protein
MEHQYLFPAKAGFHVTRSPEKVLSSDLDCHRHGRAESLAMLAMNLVDRTAPQVDERAPTVRMLRLAWFAQDPLEGNQTFD